MTTRLCKVEPHQPDRNALRLASDILHRGGLVVIPTETVYGLAANALDPQAVLGIYAAKNRPADNPLIVHVSSVDMAKEYAAEWPRAAQKLADAFWPGPLTMILPKRENIPPEVTCGGSSVAIRFPSHPVARAVIEESGLPLAAPSANRSGSPSPTCADHVVHDLNGLVDLIIDGGHCACGVESTVVTLCTNPPRLLRPGFVTVEELRDVLGEVEVDPAVFHALKDGQPVASPGMKYRHYAPRARLTLLDGSLADCAAYAAEHAGEHPTVLCFEGEETAFSVDTIVYGKEGDAASQAARLFDALRALDERGVKIAYARCPARDGVGMAVWNRVLRAAQFAVVKL